MWHHDARYVHHTTVSVLAAQKMNKFTPLWGKIFFRFSVMYAIALAIGFAFLEGFSIFIMSLVTGPTIFYLGMIFNHWIGSVLSGVYLGVVVGAWHTLYLWLQQTTASRFSKGCTTIFVIIGSCAFAVPILIIIKLFFPIK